MLISLFISLLLLFTLASQMADYGAPISLSHAREMTSQTSDDEEDDQSPRSVAPLSVCAAGGSRRASKINMENSNDKNGRSGGGGEMGSTVESASKKPRGRPPGSKNKPKPPIVITRDSESAMRPAVLEISAGSDIFEMVVQYARRRHVGLSIISGSGSVANVTLRHPGTHAPSVSLRGPLNIVSISGTFLGSSTLTPPSSSKPSSSSSSSSSFAITLAGTQGQVFGGIVAGKVTAASVVVLVAATFQNPPFHRLPSDVIEEAEETKAAGISGHLGVGVSESTTTAMSIYNVGSQPAPAPAPAPASLNCPISHDVLSWGPTSRPPPY